MFVRLSLWPNLQQPWAEIVAVVQHVERAGWDGVYVADHFMGDGGGFGAVDTPTFEATAALGALAGCTDRVRLGSLVLGATYRHPAMVANWAATIDQTCNGRFVLGVGAGWQQNEHEQYGIGLPDVGERVSRFAAYCDALRQLLNDPFANVSSPWFNLSNAVCEPKPKQTPLPLLVGGKGDRMLAITARHANEWNMWSNAEILAPRLEALTRACERIGRDPATIAVSTQALVLVTNDPVKARSLVEAVAPRPAFAGTVTEIIEQMAGWAALGVDEVIVPDFVLGHGSRRLDALDGLAAGFADLR